MSAEKTHTEVVTRRRIETSEASDDEGRGTVDRVPSGYGTHDEAAGPSPASPTPTSPNPTSPKPSDPTPANGARPDRVPTDRELVEQPSGETGGPKGPEPTRYGDWEKGGRCFDF